MYVCKVKPGLGSSHMSSVTLVCFGPSICCIFPHVLYCVVLGRPFVEAAVLVLYRFLLCVFIYVYIIVLFVISSLREIREFR